MPVAISGTDTFDATTVDLLKVMLASASVELIHNGNPMAAGEDVNADGTLDFVVHVSTEALQLSSADTVATLQGMTYDGEYIEGTDSVCIVP